jgi:hypothetical protein
MDFATHVITKPVEMKEHYYPKAIKSKDTLCSHFVDQENN